MKRTITRIRVADAADGSRAVNVPIIAGATISIESGEDDNGPYEKISLSFKTLRERYYKEFLRRDLTVIAVCDNGDTVSFGSRDIPVRFTLQDSDIITCSTTYIKV